MFIWFVLDLFWLSAKEGRIWEGSFGGVVFRQKAKSAQVKSAQVKVDASKWIWRLVLANETLATATIAPRPVQATVALVQERLALADLFLRVDRIEWHDASHATLIGRCAVVIGSARSFVGGRTIRCWGSDHCANRHQNNGYQTELRKI